jgi:hypothetical protein
MAGFEQDAFESLRELLGKTSTEAIPAAEDAAAVVFRNALRAAAPVKSGQLRSSISIIEGKDKSALSMEVGGSRRRRLFVGPEKKKGFYGFFLEKGHKTPGPRRVARPATGNTHSQSGISSSERVGATPWFEYAINSAESRALQAAETAFNQKLQQSDKRK